MAYLLQQQARRLAFYSNGSHSQSDSDEALNCTQAITTGDRTPIKRIDSNAPLHLITKTLEEDGCVIINDFTDASSLDLIRHELTPHLSNTSPSSDEKDSVRVGSVNLIKTSSTLATTLQQSSFHSILKHFLTLTMSSHQISTTPTKAHETVTTTTSTLLPHLSSTTIHTLHPPTTAEPLTRPDTANHATHTSTPIYHANRDSSIQLLLPLSDLTPATGAPNLIPGSHLWDDGTPKAEPASVVAAELEKGDALITLGSLYQGLGGWENGEKGEEKMVLEVRAVNGAVMPDDVGLLGIRFEGKD